MVFFVIGIPKMKWLTKIDELKEADIESLKRSLLTPDGMGRKFKEQVLNELISRAIADHDLRECIEGIANRTWRCGRMFSFTESYEIEETLRKLYR